ncbi:hypothetical protein BH09ACT7_BH09ACT7_22320 [soil metagenome]
MQHSEIVTALLLMDVRNGILARFDEADVIDSADWRP